jgi:predicted metal-dependent phosphoesterase TrpH
MSFKIDIHMHCSELSPCARCTAEEQCEAAIQFGLNAICFTDHHRYIPHDKLAELRAKFPDLWIIRGIETTTSAKEDIIVLGVDHPACEQKGIAYEELHRIVRKHNGFMNLAHPFRHKHDIPLDLDAFPPDTIEVHSRNTCACHEEKIQAVADRLGIPTIHVSDAHWQSVVGIYHIELPKRPASEENLFEELRKGNFKRCGDPERIAERNREVDEIEHEIKELMAKGYTEDAYVEYKGGGRGLYARVARGDSWRI